MLSAGIYVCDEFIPQHFLFLQQKTAYEMRISDWSSDVCSSDLRGSGAVAMGAVVAAAAGVRGARRDLARAVRSFAAAGDAGPAPARPARGDRKSVAQGKRVSVRVDLGGRRSIKKIQQIQKNIWCQSD